MPPPLVKCQVKKQLKPRADMGKEKGRGTRLGSEQPMGAHNTWSQLPPSLGLPVCQQAGAESLLLRAGRASTLRCDSFHSHAILPSRGTSDPCSHRRGAGETRVRQLSRSHGSQAVSICSRPAYLWEWRGVGASLTLLSGTADHEFPAPSCTHMPGSPSPRGSRVSLHPTPRSCEPGPLPGPSWGPEAARQQQVGSRPVREGRLWASVLPAPGSPSPLSSPPLPPARLRGHQ